MAYVFVRLGGGGGRCGVNGNNFHRSYRTLRGAALRRLPAETSIQFPRPLLPPFLASSTLWTFPLFILPPPTILQDEKIGPKLGRMPITMSQSSLREEVVDRVVVMRKQEETNYSYLSCLPKLPDGTYEPRLNITWREKICQWSYNVVDHFDLSREVVAVSLNLFDRFLATRGNKCNGNLALLTSLTTLHIAIKLHDMKKIKISTLANLSRGQFGAKHIEEMEWKVLCALNWNLHPPTQYAFVSHLVLFLPQEAPSPVRKELFELSRYLTELAVCDSYFVEVNNSTAAFAAILNVMDDMSYARLPAGIREKFLRDIKSMVGLSHSATSVIAARKRLKTMFDATSTTAPDDTPVVSPQRPAQEVETCSTSSMGSNGSRVRANSSDSRSFLGNRPRTNSTDSKGSARIYSQSPARTRCVVASSMRGHSRNRSSSSPMVAGAQ